MVKFTNQWERDVAAWTARHVKARDGSRVDARVATAVTAHAVELARLPQRAPSVTYVGPDDAGYVYGALASISYDGLHIALHEPVVTTSTVLHEVAHLLTDDPLAWMESKRVNEQPMHGPLFLANYLWLLGRLMGPAYNPFYLRSTMPARLCPHTIPYHPVIWGQPRSDLA